MKNVHLANYDGRQADVKCSYSDSSELFYEQMACEEKFRVDRKKLELMLQDSNGINESAEHFFQRVMRETETIVTWPSKLKIGAKSKKDPHVKINGHANGIKRAKTMIKSILETKMDQVTLKMDVSYTDHSHVIGRSGITHKSIMRETGCLIHFPDSNRNQLAEKNNQVSISGQLDGVESARACIREMMPLIFNFDLPMTGFPRPFSDKQQRFQEIYNVQVNFKQSRQDCGVTTVVVRANDSKDWQKVKDATMHLVHYCTDGKVFVPIYTTMEITPRYHSDVKESCDIGHILLRTGAKITFPDLGAFAPSTSKMTVTIAGQIDGVYHARQMLMECLPLILLFDLRDDQKVDLDRISSMTNQSGITVTVKQKNKQPTAQVTIKGIERNADMMYEARRILLASEERTLYSGTDNLHYSTISAGNGVINPCLNVEFDSFCRTYPSPNVLTLNGSNSGSFHNSTLANTNISVASPISISTPNVSMRAITGISTGGWNTSNSYPGCFSLQNHNTFLNDACQLLSGYTHASTESGYFSALSSATSTVSSPTRSPRHGSPNETLTSETYGAIMSNLGYGSSTLDSIKDLMENLPQTTSDNAHEEQACGRNSKMHSNTVANLYVDQRATGESNTFLPLCSRSDYNEKKRLAHKAMRNKVDKPEERIPTGSWSGYLFSNTMPESILKEQKLRRSQMTFEQNGSPVTGEVCSSAENDPWHVDDTTIGRRSRIDVDLGSSSNVDGFTRMPNVTAFDKCTRLDELLNAIGLEKYVRLFENQEVDLDVFLLLTDQELTTLGITTFGARKKMRKAISAINKEKNVFSPAPGAERKYSSACNNGVCI